MYQSYCVPIPVVWNNPTSENLDRAIEALAAHADKKCFVHCIVNMRISAFTYLYHVLRLGMSKDEAEKQLHQIWQPHQIWAQFITTELVWRSGGAQ